MKKSLIALAAVAATSAFAQSSVTLYGRMDLGTSSITTDTTTAGVTGSVKATSLAGAQGMYTGGRLGVRGTEDLGGGLKANFVIETRVNPDANANPTFGGTRTAMLQVAGDFGSVAVGTYLNPFDDVRLSAGTYNVPGAWTLDKVHGGTTGFNARSIDSLGYRSPVFGGGFSASFGLSGEKGTSSTVAPVTEVGGYIASVAYANGPIAAVAAFGQGKGKSSTAANPGTLNSPGVLGSLPAAATSTEASVKDFGFRFSYNFGMAVPYLSYESSTASSTNLIGNTSNGNTASRGFEIGSNFPMGAFTPYFVFANNKSTPTNGAGVAGNATKTNAFQLGTKYDLSKRTYMYGGYGVSTNKVDVTNNQVKTSGYALGLVHSF